MKRLIHSNEIDICSECIWKQIRMKYAKSSIIDEDGTEGEEKKNTILYARKRSNK